MTLITESLYTIDEETDPYFSMSLHELRQLCDKNGLRYRPTARHIELTTLLRGAMISLEFANEQKKSPINKFAINMPSQAEIQAAEDNMRMELANLEPFAFLAWCKSVDLVVKGSLTADKRNEIIDEYIAMLKE